MTTTTEAPADNYEATRQTVEAITHLVLMARPGWVPNAWQVRAVLGDLAHRVDGSDLALAAIRAAKDLGITTPRAILFRGPHWRDLATAPAEVTGGPRCSVCGKVESRCVSERPGPDDHEFIGG